MNVQTFLVTLLCFLVASVRGTTLSRDVVTYINVFRHLHAVGPLLVNDKIQKAAQQSAKKFAVTQNKKSATTSQYSANFCVFSGVQSHLPQTCVVSWYSTIGNHQWCNPQTKGPSLPFVNMIWKSSAQVGVGIAKGTGAKYFVVVYFMLQNMNLKGSVPPIKLVMEASPKAKCPAGYSRFDTSCFKYNTAQMSWDEAVIQCAKENATLTSIRNGKEETFVRGLQKTVSGDETWIGLHDRFQEGQFNWLDGLKFQPGVCVPVRATGNNKENCVAWSIKKPPGCWSDRPCAQKLPFTCRVPVEGTSTYRTEVLFKKFRWNPNFKNPNSKAYKDLIRGIKVTFNEVFTRLSGKKKAGFKKVKIKGLRPVTFPGRPVRGLAITLSVQFRSLTPDPTLRFTSFLRSSEKVLNVAIDKPDKVPGKAVGAGNYCSSPCAAAQGTCGATTTWYPQTVTCPMTCTQTTSQSCPASCPASCCNAVYQPSSPYAFYPTSSSGPVYHPPVVTHVAPRPARPVKAAPLQYPSTYAPQYPSSCPSYCGQYSTLDCYTHCNDECCKGKGQKGGKLQSTAGLISSMKKNVRHLKHVIKLAEKKLAASPASGLQNNTSQAGMTGNSVPSKLVQALQASLRALEKKLKDTEDKYIENFENDASSLEGLPENEDNSDENELIPENTETDTDSNMSAPSNNSHSNPGKAKPDLKLEKHIDKNALPAGNPSSTFTKDNDQTSHANPSSNDDYKGYPHNNSPNSLRTNASVSSQRYVNRSTPELGNTSPTPEPANNAASAQRPVIQDVNRLPETTNFEHNNTSTNSEISLGVNSSEPNLEFNPKQNSSAVIDDYQSSLADTLEARNNSSQSEPETTLNMKEPDLELNTHSNTETDTNFDKAFKSRNSSVQSSSSELENSEARLNSTNSSPETWPNVFSATKADSNPLPEVTDSNSRFLNSTRFHAREQNKSDSDLYSSEVNRFPTKYHHNSDLDFVGRLPNTQKTDNRTLEDDTYAGRLNSTSAAERNNSYSESLKESSARFNPSDLENSTDLEILNSTLANEGNKSYSESLKESSVHLNPSDLENSTDLESLNSTLAGEENSTSTERFTENSAHLNPPVSVNITDLESLNSKLTNKKDNTFVESSKGYNASDSENFSGYIKKLNSASANEENRTSTESLTRNSAHSNASHSENKTYVGTNLNEENGTSSESLTENSAHLKAPDSKNSTSTESLNENSAHSNASDSETSTATENLNSTSANEENSKYVENSKEGNAHSSTSYPRENSTGTEKSERIDAPSNSSLVDSKLKKSNNSLTGYYYGGMSTIDDGLRNSSSSKQEYMTAGRAWKQRIINNNHQSNRTNQTFAPQNDIASDSNENQAIDNQFDNDKNSDEDGEQPNADIHDPDSEIGIDGSDTLKDDTMDPPKNDNADIDDGIFDDEPIHSQRVG